MRVSTVPAHQLLDGSRAQDGESPVDSRGVVVVGVEGDVDLYTGPELRRTFADLLSPPVPGRGGRAQIETVKEAQRAAGELALEAEPPSDGMPVPVRAVIVDLSQVDFMDSYAVGVLVHGHHLARRAGAGYAVVATHPMIHTLFAVTGLAKVMPLHPDVPAALSALAPLPPVHQVAPPTSC